MTNIWTTVRQFQLNKWWDYHTLFAATPPAEWKFQWIYASLTIICLVGAIVVSFLNLRWGLKSRLLNLLWTNALLGILFYFARVQLIPYIGTDGLRLIQEITLVIWANNVLWYYRTKYKQEFVAEQAHSRFNKYLPKPKTTK